MRRKHIENIVECHLNDLIYKKINKVQEKNENNLNKDTYESLKREYDEVWRKIGWIREMKVSEEAKIPIIRELIKQADEIKEKMHKVINELP